MAPVKLIGPNGVVETVINRSEFSRKYNLKSTSHVCSVANGKLKSYKGWRLFGETNG